MYDNSRQLAEGMSGETLATIGKASPPVAVSVATIAGLSLQDWVMILTAIYTLLSTAHLIYKFLREQRAEREKGVRP